MEQSSRENSMETQEQISPKRAVGFTFRQRLLPTLLLAIALGLTLCLIGPCDIYFNNIDEFLFSAGDFVLWNLLFFVVLAGAVCGILLPLRGRWFDVTFGVFFAIALMLFVQGNYLNGGMNSLAGDGVGEVGVKTGALIVNTVVWITVMVGCVLTMLLLKAQYREWIGTVATIAMVTVIGMQLIPLAVSGLTAERTEEPYESFLTYDNLEDIGQKNNVFYFVVDRFDYSFYENYALKEAPELFENMDGFTYYNDMVSLYPRTYPAVPYMLTGVEHDFLDARIDYMDEAYKRSEFLNLMHDEGYQVNIYTDEFYGYNDANSMKAYVSNATHGEITTRIVHKLSLSWDMVRLSLYRYFPICAKGVAGNISTPSFKRYVEYDGLDEQEKYTTDMRNAYLYLNDNAPELSDVEKNFSFIHLEGCHVPNPYNEKFEPATTAAEQNSPTVSLKQSFKIINMYLLKLKELGLYEDATIIISGDHASLRGSDTELLNAPSKDGPFLTALFVKPSGSAGTPMQVSSAPIAQSDIVSAILQSEGIETELDFGRSVFEIGEDEVRERFVVFHRRLSGNDEEVIFKVTGSGRDMKNWTIESRDKFVGDLYS